MTDTPRTHVSALILHGVTGETRDIIAEHAEKAAAYHGGTAREVDLLARGDAQVFTSGGNSAAELAASIGTYPGGPRNRHVELILHKRLMTPAAARTLAAELILAAEAIDPTEA